MKERIRIFCKTLDIPVREFENRCNLSNGYVGSMRKGIGPDKLNNILKEFPQLNRDWLLFGEGEMMKENINVSADHGSAASAIGDATVNNSGNVASPADFIGIIKAKDQQITELLRQNSKLIDIISNQKP